MEGRQAQTLFFGKYRLDTHKRLLFKEDGAAVPLMPKSYATLEYLVSNAGRTVTKDELMEAVWGETAVEENNLNQCISAIRKSLEEKRGENRFIATIPGTGYEFVSEVTSTDPVPLKSAAASEKESRGIFLSTPARRLILILISASLITAALVLSAKYNAVGSPGVKVPPASLAILPFKSLDENNSDEALELGMTDALISRLRQGLDLPVSPLSSVRRFRSAQTDPLAAGKELGVDTVLDGSVQTTADRIRVSVRLIRTDDGEQMWFASFDEDLGDIFAVQDSIAERVAAALEKRLKPDRKPRAPQNPEAYQQYLKGRYVSFRLTLPNVLKAIEYFERSISIDPGFVPAYAGLTDAYRGLVLTSDYPPRETMEKALSSAERAVELDPGSSEAQSSLAFIKFWYLWDWEGAELHLKKAVDADSSNVLAHAYYAHFLSNMGRHSEALAEIRRAKDLDPRNPLVNSIEGQIQFHTGELRIAAEHLKETIDLEGDMFLACLVMAKVRDEQGDHLKAAEYAKRAYELSGGNAESLARRGFALAKAGRWEEAAKIRKELEEMKNRKYVPPYALAIADLGLGDRQKALSDLEKAFEEKNAQMVFLKVEPKWGELRSEPRFRELLKKMRLE